MEHPAYQAIQNPPSPTQEAVPANPSPNHSGGKWKKWMLIGFLLIIIALPLGIFILSQQKNDKPQEKTTSQQAVKPSPTPDPTADWKTYTNDEYNFRFKYPPQYFVAPVTQITKSYNSDGQPLEITEYGFPFSLGKMFNGTPDQSGFILEVRPTFGKTIAEEYGNNTALGGGRVEITYLTETSGAEEAAIIRPSNSGRVYRAGNYFYLVSSIQNVNGDSSTFIKLEDIYKTFKFTDPSPSITAKDPKTACEQNGGKWLANYNECEAASGGLDEKTCKELGGVYKSCDSACRHDPNAQGCIEVCINVCKF